MFHELVYKEVSSVCLLESVSVSANRSGFSNPFVLRSHVKVEYGTRTENGFFCLSLSTTTLPSLYPCDAITSSIPLVPPPRSLNLYLKGILGRRDTDPQVPLVDFRPRTSP